MFWYGLRLKLRPRLRPRLGRSRLSIVTITPTHIARPRLGRSRLRPSRRGRRRRRHMLIGEVLIRNPRTQHDLLNAFGLLRESFQKEF